MLNVFELNRSRDEKTIRKVETYRQVLTRVHSKIRGSSEKGYSFCFYQVPPFILGVPIYDLGACCEYIIDRLYKNGLVVVFTRPNNFFISWEHIPSSLTCPEVKELEEKMAEDPYKDYSKVVHRVASAPLSLNTTAAPYSYTDRPQPKQPLSYYYQSSYQPKLTYNPNNY